MRYVREPSESGLKTGALTGSGGCGLSLSQVLVGEEALLKKLKSYEKENEALKKKLAQVMMHFS